MDKFKTFPDKMACPCGSEKTYENCCKKKKFKYKINNTTLRKEIPMHKHLVPILKEIEKRFQEYYNRKPSKNDLIFTFAPLYNDDVLLRMTYSLRESELPEDKIYAFFKSNGLLPNEFNIDLISEKDLKEYQLLGDEYNKLIKSKKMNIVQYVMSTNIFIDNQINYVIEALTCALNDFIQRHIKSKTVLEYQMSSELDYCIFSALKTLKTIRSIQILKEHHMTECIYSLSRSIFENYMYICNIIIDSTMFSRKILPKVDEINYSFEIRPDGKINYNKVLNKQTGEKTTIKIDIYDLVKNLPYDSDRELYNVFYQTVCQYVHVNIMSAKSYYSVLDPYEEIDPSLIACLIVSVLMELLLFQISQHKDVKKEYKNDISFLCNNILTERLKNCLIMANSDPEHKNAILELLIKRIDNQLSDTIS